MKTSLILVGIPFHFAISSAIYTITNSHIVTAILWGCLLTFQLMDMDYLK
jgi:hypothetical protein